MALTLVATVGASNSNSYVTEAEADAYFEAESHFFPTWSAYTSQEKIARLISATRAVDRFDFLSEKVDKDQALQFPRVDNGDAEPDELDHRVKDAQMQMVMHVETFLDSETNQQSQELKSVDIDEVLAVTFDSLRRTQNTASAGSWESVKSLLSHWLSGFNNFSVIK